MLRLRELNVRAGVPVKVPALSSPRLLSPGFPQAASSRWTLGSLALHPACPSAGLEHGQGELCCGGLT